MSVKRNGGLGRNLSALLGSSYLASVANNTPKTQIIQLAIDSLQPGKYQPRTVIEDAPLQELANSIKQQGLMQPLVVRALDDSKYEIIAGERRWRACRIAGLEDIPVIVHEVDDETAMAMALIENLQREDLNPVDQARAMARLIDEFSMTHQQIAELLSKSRATVSNFLRLLSLAGEVMRLLEHGDLDMGHARCLLILDKEQQLDIAKLIIAKQLSVRDTEKLVNRVKQGHKEPPAVHQQPDFIYVQQHIKALGNFLNTKVTLKQSKAGKGSLVINYDSVEWLESVIKKMIG